MLLSPPSHLGYPLPSGFSIVQNAPLPFHSVRGSLQGQGRVPRPSEVSCRGPATPGMPLIRTTLFTKQTGHIQSFYPNPDLQDPGQLLRPLPHPLGTLCYQLYHYCTCPVCAGRGLGGLSF